MGISVHTAETETATTPYYSTLPLQLYTTHTSVILAKHSCNAAEQLCNHCSTSPPPGTAIRTVLHHTVASTLQRFRGVRAHQDMRARPQSNHESILISTVLWEPAAS